MLSGVEVRAHGMTFDDFHADRGFIRVPTALSVAHDAGFSTAMFVSKAKLRHIAVPGSVDRLVAAPLVVRARGRRRRGVPRHRHRGDHLHPLLRARRLGPPLRVDARALPRGHRPQRPVLHHGDEPVEARADRGRFLVIATADHGGHGRRHGTHAPEDLHIPWVAWGSRVTRGDFSDPVRTTDTAATALAALGVAVPAGFTGRPVQRVLAPAPTP
jgi:hypothetical protein